MHLTSGDEVQKVAVVPWKFFGGGNWGELRKWGCFQKVDDYNERKTRSYCYDLEGGQEPYGWWILVRGKKIQEVEKDGTEDLEQDWDSKRGGARWLVLEQNSGWTARVGCRWSRRISGMASQRTQVTWLTEQNRMESSESQSKTFDKDQKREEVPLSLTLRCQMTSSHFTAVPMNCRSAPGDGTVPSSVWPVEWRG